ncbi:hypothetical protein ES703_41617 [subsurface metagenome]
MEWGKLAIINLYECNKGIKKKSKIKEFIQILCKIINMKRVGPARIKRFGKDKLKGYSAFQFIETSSIICHFDEIQNRAFIDIFSCKNFDEKRAEQFSKDFFKAKKSKIKILDRK